MSTKTISATIVGLDAVPVEVEVDVDRAMYAFMVVGLADTAVQEARERVRAAIKNCDFDYPQTRITANLAPADIRKEGPSFDLPLAVALIAERIDAKIELEDKVFIGELSLEGKVRSVKGVLPVAVMAREKGFKELYVPLANAQEAAIVSGVEVYGVEDLRQLIAHLRGSEKMKPISFDPTLTPRAIETDLDFKFVKGQEQAKRALEIVAAGGHNVLMSGPPGSGKTMLARTLVTILPRMDVDESLETTKIHSIAGILPKDRPLITTRPFRSPHHSASAIALVGGGTWPRPGEISLAHRGVLFLDEFPEFPRAVLENLRQPLEDGVITISRAQGTLSFPAKFVLVSSMNPCPCGYLTDPKKDCVCTPLQIASYQKKLSGPLLDRIDLHVEVPRVEADKLQKMSDGESSEIILARVEQAHAIQRKRFLGMKIKLNGEMSSVLIRQYCEIDATITAILKEAISSLGLSARAYFRILKVSRTIADLAGSEKIKKEYVLEALQYRQMF